MKISIKSHHMEISSLSISNHPMLDNLYLILLNKSSMSNRAKFFFLSNLECFPWHKQWHCQVEMFREFSPIDWNREWLSWRYDSIWLQSKRWMIISNIVHRSSDDRIQLIVYSMNRPMSKSIQSDQCPRHTKSLQDTMKEIDHTEWVFYLSLIVGIEDRSTMNGYGHIGSGFRCSWWYTPTVYFMTRIICRWTRRNKGGWNESSMENLRTFRWSIVLMKWFHQSVQVDHWWNYV